MQIYVDFEFYYCLSLIKLFNFVNFQQFYLQIFIILISIKTNYVKEFLGIQENIINNSNGNYCDDNICFL